MSVFILKGQHFHVTESALAELMEGEYFDERVMTSVSIQKPTFICVGYDEDGDPVGICLDVFKPEMLDYDKEEMLKFAWEHPYAFFICEEYIEVVL